jgi:hypothetical protein
MATAQVANLPTQPLLAADNRNRMVGFCTLLCAYYVLPSRHVHSACGANANLAPWTCTRSGTAIRIRPVTSDSVTVTSDQWAVG